MSNRRLRWVVLCALLVTGAPASADGISGTYVGKGSNSAFLVQIVETADGHLTGRYEQVILQQDGKLDDMNAAISGAADGQTVVGTIKPPDLLSGGTAISGTIQGSLLHLTGGGNLVLNLLRSDEGSFRTQVSVLTEQSRLINEAKIEAKQLANLQNLTQQMVDYSTHADGQLPKFVPTEQRYHAITEHMRAALTREQSIYGSGQPSVHRGQISVGITQASIETTQMHIRVQSAFQDLGHQAHLLIQESAGPPHKVAGAHTSPRQPIPHQRVGRLGIPHVCGSSMFQANSRNESRHCARRSPMSRKYGARKTAHSKRSCKSRMQRFVRPGAV